MSGGRVNQRGQGHSARCTADGLRGFYPLVEVERAEAVEGGVNFFTG
jgi:hypothetical protein